MSSLLWMEYEKEFENLVEKSFQREWERKEEYFHSLSQRIRDIIRRDTKYNVDYLYTAYVLKEEQVMTTYAVWLYQLMDGIFKQFTKEESMEYVLHHLKAIEDTIPEVVSEEKQETLLQFMRAANDSIVDFVKQGQAAEDKKSKYEDEIQEYMDSLMKKDTRKSMQLVQEFIDKDIPLDDIYVEILAESMKRVGDLWHTAEITVDTEHYCTSVTQMAMAQMYSKIFEAKRNDKMVLCVCPGMELHEMGARIVADLFANDGWDSVFLGAAVPVEYVMQSIRDEQPDLLTLSVSMPQHLMDCLEIIEMVRKEFPKIKIAVGGKAFDSTDEIWKKWPIDIYTKDARQLLAKANEIC